MERERERKRERERERERERDDSEITLGHVSKVFFNSAVYFLHTSKVDIYRMNDQFTYIIHVHN